MVRPAFIWIRECRDCGWPDPRRTWNSPFGVEVDPRWRCLGCGEGSYDLAAMGREALAKAHRELVEQRQEQQLARSPVGSSS